VRFGLLAGLAALCALVFVATASATHLTSFSLGPASVSIGPGGTATYTGTVGTNTDCGLISTYGFNLSATGAPAGSTVTFTPQSAPPNGPLSVPFTMTVQVPSTAAVGSYTVVANVDFTGGNGGCVLGSRQASVGLDVVDSDLALAQPSNVTVDATSPAGAVVTYTNPAATDESLATVTVSCLPASGSTFAIGDTTVTCTATDTDGDTNSPVQNTFNVHVKGAAEQLADLALAVVGVGPGTSLADKVAAAQAYLAAGDISDACGTMNAFINEVKAQSGKSIPPATASSLITAAQQIRAVLGC
jgi:hypothetical protein